MSWWNRGVFAGQYILSRITDKLVTDLGDTYFFPRPGQNDLRTSQLHGDVILEILYDEPVLANPTTRDGHIFVTVEEMQEQVLAKIRRQQKGE